MIFYDLNVPLEFIFFCKVCFGPTNLQCTT